MSQQQQQPEIDGCFREMRHPRPKKRKELEKKKENCKILFATFFCSFCFCPKSSRGSGRTDKSAGAEDYKICNLRRGHNRKYKSFRFITRLVEIIKRLPATWSGCCQARVEDANPLARAGSGSSRSGDWGWDWGASPQPRRLSVVVVAVVGSQGQLGLLGKCGAASVILFGQFSPLCTRWERIFSSRRAFWRFRFHFSNGFPFF